MGVISPAAAEELTKTELTPAQATPAAELLLKALKERQGDAMHDALAARVQESVYVKTVKARPNQRLAIDATRIVSVIAGYNTTTIDAVVTTASSDDGMLMVLDEDGKLLAWKWTNQIQPIETMALDFTRDLAAGRLLRHDRRCPCKCRKSWLRGTWNAKGSSSARCLVGSGRSRSL